ncbi:MAG: OmpA family protein [Syntrophaceae bacterium]|nr:OmpA family protein [Syntrophaceae bacterium]
MYRIRSSHKKGVEALGPEGIGGRWLVTFNDMITLILTFFVLILSMSDMDRPSIDQISQSVSEAFGIGGIRAPLVPPRAAQPSVDRGQIQAERNAEISKMAIKIAALPGMEAQQTPGGVRVTMNEQVLFASESDVLGEDSHRVLMSLVPLLKESDAFIRVEGHTDNLPVATERFPSNWELSTARAVSVVNFLAQEGSIDPARMSAVGYGDAKSLAGNDNPQGRQKNRRVEINLKFQE